MKNFVFKGTESECAPGVKPSQGCRMAQSNFFAVLSNAHCRGFSLVELMIVVVIFFFVVGAVLDIYISQHHASVTQAQVSDTQQNARIAMDFLSKEIRMAGFGMPTGGVTIGGTTFSDAIDPVNNDSVGGNNVLDGTDEITIITGYRQISALANSAVAGATQITLNAAADKFNTTTRRYVCIDGIGAVDVYEVTGIIGNTLTVTPSLNRSYVQEAPVMLVKAITYSVNDAGVLTRDENTGGGAQPLVPHIEDLQFAYQVDGDTTWYDTPGTLSGIRAVRINVLARTRAQDRQPGESGTIGRRPDIEDHDVDNVIDGFRRRLLTSVVKVRNLGL